MEPANNNVPSGGEASLDELLDSCLDDFDKPVPKVMTVTSDASDSPSGSALQGQALPNLDLKPPDETNWGEEFTQFQNVMENFLGGEGNDFSDIRNLLGDLNVGAEGTEALEESFLKTIKDLTEGAQNIPQISPDELAGMFSGFDLNEPESGETDQLPEFMPLMHNVMQKLMSKELLYPSLKEIVDKYPGWLDEKQSSLKPDEYEKYKEQYELMKTVCDEFEAQNESDSDEAKKERFENILRLMTKIQNCGNPPKDLVSDIGGQNVPIDEHGNLQIPAPGMCDLKPVGKVLSVSEFSPIDSKNSRLATLCTTIAVISPEMDKSSSDNARESVLARRRDGNFFRSGILNSGASVFSGHLLSALPSLKS